MSWRGITDHLKHSPAAMRLADFLGRGRGRLRWFDSLHAPAKPPLPDLSGWRRGNLATILIGHSTVLLRIGGMTILTDPVFSNRIGVGMGLFTGGPRRMIAPALSLRQLPPIDLIIVSHAHFDHLDRPTLARLPHSAPVITAPHNRDLIADLGFRQIVELPWGHSVRIGDLNVTAQEAKHWGARTFFDHHRGFAAFLLEGGQRRVLYGGDTAYHESFKAIGKVDMAILGISAYDPYIQAHATPEQAWAMANHVKADHILPMHHSTFRLSHEPMRQPMERMLKVAGRAADRIVICEVGGQWNGN